MTKKKLKSRIAIILDRSSSMEAIRTEAIAVFNEQVAAIKKGAKGIDTKVSLVTFSSVSDVPIFWNEDVKVLKKLTTESYKPDGMTAMYDAVGTTIDDLKKLTVANEKDTSFLVVIISDGEENNSKKYQSKDIAERVSDLQKTGRWTFTYLGANQDLSVVSQKLGILRGNMAAFTATRQGAVYASSINASATAGYMSGVSAGKTQSTNFYSSDSTDTKDTETK